MCGKILKGINQGFNWRFIRLKPSHGQMEVVEDIFPIKIKLPMRQKSRVIYLN
jgi:hypothetical protein